MSGKERNTIHRVIRGQNGNIRATWRILVSFAVFLTSLVVLSIGFGMVPFPDVLINFGGALSMVGGVGALLFVGTRFLGQETFREYGFELNREWWLDFCVAIIFGFVFQAIVTALTIQFGIGSVVGQFSTGAGSGIPSVGVAVASTVFLFLAVGLWEELLFRSVIIQNAAEGLRARGLDRRTAVAVGLLVSVLVFGIPHLTAVAGGASLVFAVLQASTAGVYFGLAYALTGSLALPIGLHFATNLWTATVFGQPDSGFPSLFVMERSLQADASGIVVLVVPSLVLVGLIVGWVYVTRGELVPTDSAYSVRTDDSQTSD